MILAENLRKQTKSPISVYMDSLEDYMIKVANMGGRILKSEIPKEVDKDAVIRILKDGGYFLEVAENEIGIIVTISW